MFVVLFLCMFVWGECTQRNLINCHSIEEYKEWNPFRIMGIVSLESNNQLKEFYQQYNNTPLNRPIFGGGSQRFKKFSHLRDIKNFFVSYQKEQGQLSEREIAGFFVENENEIIIFDFVTKYQDKEQHLTESLLFLVQELIKKKKKICIVGDDLSVNIKDTLIGFGFNDTGLRVEFFGKNYGSFVYEI